jgi:heat-inducible transcriptional repressor
MLSYRSGKILQYIVGEYIDHVAPVPSQDIADNAELGVSPATIRNEMAYLEREGYLIRPHTSAGCIPSDTGYRYYVQEIRDASLPWEEQRRISHTFHQVEKEVEAWVSLTATLLAQSAQNVAVVSLPKSTDCKLKHLELIAVHDERALAVVVLDGARVRQKLVSFSRNVAQPDLIVVSNKLNAAYDGLTAAKIAAAEPPAEPLEKEAADFLIDIMKAEDSREYQEPYLEGWHFMLDQPEFAQSGHMRTLMELVERRGLLKVIAPPALNEPGAHVIIGSENKDEAIRNCSVVICQYGLADEASGTIAVVGPTRMPYRRTIPTVAYLSAVLSQLVAGLYGREYHDETDSE